MNDRAAMELSFGPSRSLRKDQAKPLRVLVLSPLSPSAADSTALGRPRRVNIDNFDQLFGAVAPTLPLSSPDTAETAVAMQFGSLDELHPDALAGRLPNIEALRALAARLANPATEANALRDLAALRHDAGSGAPAPPRAVEPPAAASSTGLASGGGADTDDDAMFGRLLGRTRSQDSQQTRAQQIVKSLIGDALGATQSQPSSGLAASAAGQVTELMNESLRASLMARPFRELERAWRSLHWLVSRVDDADAEIHVVDVSKPRIAAEIEQHRDRLESSAIHRLLCTDDDGWDLIVGDFNFELEANDLILLATLGALAARAQAPFVAGGELSLAGCPGPESVDSPWDWSLPDDELGALWRELRAHPAARWIALAAPRFVLRQPYGTKSDPIDTFAFEELPARPSTDRFLWGNPAFPCALLMIQAHAAGEPHWPATAVADVDDLPTPVYNDGTGEAMQPGVEFLLSERACATAGQNGLITFASGRNTNRMRSSGIGPIAS